MAEIKFIKALYKGPGISGLEENLQGGLTACELYFLCTDTSTAALHSLEIIRGTELAKGLYDGRCYSIIGAANKKSEALELVRLVICDFLKTEQSFNLLGDYLRGL